MRIYEGFPNLGIRRHPREGRPVLLWLDAPVDLQTEATYTHPQELLRSLYSPASKQVQVLTSLAGRTVYHPCLSYQHACDSDHSVRVTNDEVFANCQRKYNPC